MPGRGHVTGCVEVTDRVTPFSFVSALTETKADFYEGNEKEYNPFIINKALSFNLDCLFHVCELNKYYSIPKQSQFQYLMGALDKKRRNGRWVKKESLPADIAILREAYGYSDDDAVIALELLSDKQLLELKQKMSKGGRK